MPQLSNETKQVSLSIKNQSTKQDQLGVMALPKQHRVLLGRHLPTDAARVNDTSVDQYQEAPVAIARCTRVKVKQRCYPGDLSVQRSQCLQAVQHQRQGCPDLDTGIVLALCKVIQAGSAELTQDIPGSWLRQALATVPWNCCSIILH